MMPGSRARPLAITLIDSQEPVAADAHADHARDAAEGPRTLGQRAPVLLFVGDTAISEAEIAREMQFHRAMKPAQSRAAAARALVVRELLRREAEQVGIAHAVEPHPGEPLEEACIRVLLEREVESRTPSDDDCLRYFEQNPGRFHAPLRLRLRHVLLAAAPDDVNGRFGARARAESLIAELKAQPHLFADFALRHSDCPSKGEGGDLGWLERGQTVPEFDRQVFRLRQGLAGFPVESRWGYHVVHVDEIAAGAPLAFEAVHQRIRDYLELQVRQQALQQYLLELQHRYTVRGLDAIEAAA